MLKRSQIPTDQTLAALSYYESTDQVCLRNQRLLDEQLTLLETYEVEP